MFVATVLSEGKHKTKGLTHDGQMNGNQTQKRKIIYTSHENNSKIL